MPYVAYYRVSTQKQGESGLGLEAQQAAVRAYVQDPAAIVATFQEVESGKNNQRPELAKAVAECRRTGATLLVAKLDRMSRDAAYILRLEVPFVAADMPELNTLTKGIFASLAQHERELVSKRTKEALAAKKARGERLGNQVNLSEAGRAQGRRQQQENARTHKANVQAQHLILLLREKGLSLRAIAHALNEKGYCTRRGCAFTAKGVQLLLQRAA
jgi:DNA invertase Pin-like site-specific DNA recombinase